MKFMLNVCFVVYFALIIETAVAQNDRYRPFPDSIRIELSEAKVVLVMGLKKADRDIAWLESFPDSLALWIAGIEKSLSKVSTPHRVNIVTGNGGTEINILEPEKKLTHVTMNQGVTTQLLPPGWELFVRMKNYEAYVYAQEFEGLKKISSVSLQPAIVKLKEEFKNSPCYRRRSQSRIIVKEQQVAFSQCDCQGPYDFLILNGSSGLGYLGNTFYPELNLDITIRFSRSDGVSRNKIVFSYNNLFFTERKADGGYQVFPNSFASVSFNRNIASKDKVSWLGFGAGYLITSNGDYFKGNTMKFFISKKLGDIRVIPEVYLTDNFKSYLFGLKFNFTF